MTFPYDYNSFPETRLPLRSVEDAQKHLYYHHLAMWCMFLPTTYNDGSEIPNEDITDFGQLVLDLAGGYTVDQHPCVGVWRAPNGDIIEEPVHKMLIMTGAHNMTRIADCARTFFKQEEIMFFTMDYNCRASTTNGDSIPFGDVFNTRK